MTLYVLIICSALCFAVSKLQGVPKLRCYRAAVLQIYGPEASGKTTLALHAIAEIQKLKGNCLFIDAEHAFDSAYATVRMHHTNLIDPEYVNMFCVAAECSLLQHIQP